MSTEQQDRDGLRQLERSMAQLSQKTARPAGVLERLSGMGLAVHPPLSPLRGERRNWLPRGRAASLQSSAQCCAACHPSEAMDNTVAPTSTRR